MRYWGYWKLTPRDPAISPCGYLEKSLDVRCRGCADDPRPDRDNALDAEQKRIQEAWAKRWVL